MKARIWITAAVLLVLLSAILNLFSACRSDEEEEGDVTTTSALPDEKLAAREKDNAFAYDVYQTYVEITSYHGQSAIVSVPATHGGLPVASVGQSAFMNNTVISRVSLPESVVNIAAMAVMGCSSLQNVTVPGIRAVGVSAFRGSGLTEVELPVTLQNLGQYAFAGTALSSVELNCTVPIVGDYAFSDCARLTEVILGEGIAEISYRMFEHCTALQTVRMTDRVKKVDAYAFAGCTALRELTLPTSVTELGEGVFYGVSDITVTAKRGSAAYEYCGRNSVPCREA